MATVVIMPKQGQSVESCILTEMKKKKGDTVAVGDILFAYETDKASFEEEAQVAGTVLDVFFDNGDEIPVLTNVMVIGNEGESTDEFRPGGAVPAAEVAAPAAAATEAPAEVKTTAPAPAAAPAAAPSGTMSPVSPRAKALAEKEAVNAAALTGTGPHGRVIERDVKAAAEAAPKTTPLAKAIIKETGAALPTAGSGLAGMAKGADVGALKNSVYATDSEIKPISNMRKIIAKAMHASLQNSAQLTHHLSADARRIMALRKKVKKAVENGYPTNITLNDMVCMAVIKALKKFPQVNAHFLGGNYGVEIFTPVINLPQVAILGVNTIVPRPKDLGGGVYGFVPHIGLSLTYDHRALDGGEATRFVKQIATEIENLEFEL